jgi:signal transduction histidine kinase
LKPYSVIRRLIATVLVLELAAALALTWLAVAFEAHSRFHSFDIALKAHADTLFGGVGDSDDPQDNVVLDLHSVDIPSGALFDVETASGKILGRSVQWPAPAIDKQLPTSQNDGTHRVLLYGKGYRFVILHAVRVVDPGEKGGGVKRPVVVRYGASTAHVWSEVWEAVRFYALASLVLLTATGLALSWTLRRHLQPLAALADEAARISAQQWQFHPRAAAYAMVELAPLTTALELAIKRLQRSFEQQRRFTSDAAHELKTDLAIAKSSLQLLAMRRRSPEKYEQGLEVCLADILRIERTVMEMLTLARVESGDSESCLVAAHPYSDLAGAVHEAVHQFASLAELRDVGMKLDVTGGEKVRIGAEDARLLFTNLLHNALHHSRASTEVTITLSQTEGWATLTIEDQGEGISPESLPHVFQPFYRGDVSRNRSTGSTGLGLAICKGICDRAGGEISIQSRPALGTVVTVRLPAAKEEASVAQTSA